MGLFSKNTCTYFGSWAWIKKEQRKMISTCSVFISNDRFPLILKSKFVQPLYNILIRHKQLPEEACAVILDHSDNRSLINGQIAIGKPVPLFRKGIIKSIFSPQAVSKVLIKIP